jgi:RNA polymerase sigma-70 factor (ECF subfamily)
VTAANVHPNPLGDSPCQWDSLIQDAGPATLLVIIRSRMGGALQRQVCEEDILQEAFLRAWRSRHSFQWRGLKSFRAWLLTLIDHCIADAATREAALKRGGDLARRTLSDLERTDSENTPMPIPEALIASTTPSRIAMYKEQAAAIEAALDSLPDDVRPVVRLRIIEQLPINDAAQRLGIGPSVVRHRLYKGAQLYRQRLAALLSTNLGGEPSGAFGGESASN